MSPETQHHVARLNGHVGPGADREPGVRRCEGGGVVDAVADERDATARRLERAHHVGLARREHLGVDLCDAKPGSDRLGGAAVVPGDHGQPQAARAQRVERRSGGLFDGVGDGDERDEGAVYGDPHGRLAFRRERLRASLICTGRREARLVEQARGPDRDRPAFHLPADARANGGLHVGRDGQRTVFEGPRDERRANRVLALLLDGRREPERLSAGHLAERDEVGHGGPPERQRARLVEQDGVGFGERLQARALADEGAQLGGAAGAHQNRDRRGDAHGARAGDDEYRDRGHERVGQRGVWSPDHPRRRR